MSPSYLLNRALWGIILILLPLFYLQIAWGNPVDFQSGGLGAGDFKAYYVASRLLDEGENIYELDLQQAETAAIGYNPDITYYLYPALLATALLPLSRLPMNQAVLIWNTINLCLLIIIVLLITETFELRNKLATHYPWFVLLFFIATPVTIALRIGQANIMTLFFVALCFWADKRNNARLSGFALAVATLLKIFPVVILIWFLWQKKYQMLTAFSLTAILLVITNAGFLAVTGRYSLTDWYYFTHVLPNLQPPSQYDNHALSGFLHRYSINTPIIRLLSTGLILLLSGLSILRAMLSNQKAVAHAILLCMALLITSLTWTSTLIFLSIPLAVLIFGKDVQSGNGRFSIPILAIAFGYFCINGVRLLFNLGISVTESKLVLSLPFIGTIIIWSGLLYIANKKRLSGFPHLLS
ncbi:MAG: DUF2029 domain-containing protein [Chloroflexi bacterium]|nr:DUF2029 domain-containing protein [Chloroflexota bacterium]MBP7043420.1 DUF2029 domain-containing protein [Chloroflexota bacterium]